MSYKRIIFCIVFASFIFSCEDNTVDYGLDRYYVEIVTAQGENVFLSDNGNKIVAISNNNRVHTQGDRVLLSYTLLETSASGDYNVRINRSSKISQGKITLTGESNINSAAKEPILLESVWLGSHYLNMQFYINYKSEAHKIGLLVDSTRLKSDTISMYFVHDKVNDPPGYPVNTYFSVDLSNVLGKPEKSRPISVQINTSNYGNKTYEFEY